MGNLDEYLQKKRAELGLERGEQLKKSKPILTSYILASAEL